MTGQIFLGLGLSAIVGGVAYWRRALTASGLLGAVLIGTLIFGFGGWIWGLVLITFFVSSSMLSHYRRADKETAVEEFAKGSRRDLGQTLANGAVAAVLALVYSSYPHTLLFAAFLGTIGTVNADTWATELGVLSRIPPHLITTGEEVPPGTSGGVTRLGIWASVAGALLIGTVAMALAQAWSLLNGRGWSLEAVSFPLIAVAGGVAGSLFDSLLGATAQATYYCDLCDKVTESPTHHCGQATSHTRGWSWLNNDVVNFAASLVGGLIAASLAWILWN